MSATSRPPEHVHLRGYGFVRVTRIVPTDGDMDDAQHWATSDLAMTESTRRRYATMAGRSSSTTGS